MFVFNVLGTNKDMHLVLFPAPLVKDRLSSHMFIDGHASSRRYCHETLRVQCVMWHWDRLHTWCLGVNSTEMADS